MYEIRHVVDLIDCPLSLFKQKVYTDIITVKDGELADCKGCDNMSGSKECLKCVEHFTLQYSTCLKKESKKQ